MERFELSAWTLAGGGFSVFALAVVLKQAPWQVAFAFLVVTVALWALRAPAVAGGVLGLVAWMFLTGFDVEKTGDLVFTGTVDVVRLSVLIAAGFGGALAGRLLGLGAGPGREELHPTVLRVHEPSGVSLPRPRGLAVSEEPIKESSHV